MADLKLVKPTTRAQKATRTTLKTEIFTREEIEKWLLPPFQRNLKVTAKVLEIAKEIKEDGGIIPGVLTLGVMGDKYYLLDGQHRRAAFLESGCPECMVDIRLCHFDTMGEMGEEFVRLNSSIVRMKADDTLRGLEASLPALQRLHRLCPFIGYDNIRRGHSAPVVSMSTVLRIWHQSTGEILAQTAGSVLVLANALDEETVTQIAAFMRACFAAWGRDEQNTRLWSGLNLGLCAWLWRNTVTHKYSVKTFDMTADQFTKCLMELSADQTHVAWLQGRRLDEINRAPAYSRTKIIFNRRILADTGKKALLPQPEWGGRGTR